MAGSPWYDTVWYGPGLAKGISRNRTGGRGEAVFSLVRAGGTAMA